MFVLSIYEDKNLIKQHPLQIGMSTIGSSRAADICLPDLESFHIAIEVDNARADMSTLDSSQSPLSQLIEFNRYTFKIDQTDSLLTSINPTTSDSVQQTQVLIMEANGQRLQVIPFMNKKSLMLEIDQKKVVFRRADSVPVNKTFEMGPYLIRHISLPQSASIPMNWSIDRTRVLPLLISSIATFAILQMMNLSYSEAPTADSILDQLVVENQQTLRLEKPPEKIAELKTKQVDAAQVQAIDPSPSQALKSTAVTAKEETRAQNQGTRVQNILGRVAKATQNNARKIVTANGSESSKASAIASIGPATGDKSVGLQLKGEDTLVGIEAIKGNGTGRMAASLGGMGAANALSLMVAESKISGGLDRDLVNSIIKSHLGNILYCYERQLSADPSLKGKLKVKFEIGAQGRVVSQAVLEKSLYNAKVEGCVLSQVASWNFPKPDGGTKVVVTYPFIFSKTGDAQ